MVSRWVVCVVSLLSLVAAVSIEKHHHSKHKENKDGTQDRYMGFVFYDPKTNTYTFSNTKADGACASGWLDDTLEKTGWGELTIETSDQYSDAQQAYAAGYLEGALTHTRIAQLLAAIDDGKWRNPATIDFIQKQDQFLRHHIDELGVRDENRMRTETNGDNVYWYHVMLVITQMDGLLAAHNALDPKKLTLDEMWRINNDGDILDIERITSPGRVFKSPSSPQFIELVELMSYSTRCSALVKWTGADLLCGHSTWSDFTELNRIYKHYQFHFHHPSTVSHRSSHSSYPGMISSSDDFYVLDSGLVVMETTLNILDESIYSRVKPDASVMAWIRNLVANRMAHGAGEWCELFSNYNSGTQNNQWMIIDYKLFQPNQAQLQPGTLFILEQIPGYTKSRDISADLATQTYWASYNRPFFSEINEDSQYQKYAQEHGELFSYKDCPRAKIFAREHANVHTLEDMKRVMRLNQYTKDPFSKGCPGEAIAARFDLPPAPGAACEIGPRPNGATDSKITSSTMVPSLSAWAISGPTHDDQPTFVWSKSAFSSQRPPGVPDVWQFDWKLMAPHQ